MVVVYILEFLVFSFVGWLIDSGYRSVTEKRWINAGYFRGPICPIYGIGALTMVYFFKIFSTISPLILLLGAGILLTLVEYIGGIFSEKILRVRLWDYSSSTLHLGGHIDLIHSFYWFLLAAFFYGFILPFVLLFETIIYIPEFLNLPVFLLFLFLAIWLTLRKNPYQFLNVPDKILKISVSDYKQLFILIKKYLRTKSKKTKIILQKKMRPLLEKAGVSLKQHFILIFFIFLFGCQTFIEQSPTPFENSNTSIEEPSPFTLNETKNLPQTNLTACQAGWQCVSLSTKAYRAANCSWQEIAKCKFGCENNTCRPGVVCTAGFKCENNKTYGLQNEGCEWVTVDTCQWGCTNQGCNPLPANYTPPAPPEKKKSSAISETTTPPPAAETINTLKVAETVILSLDNQNHTLRIYNIEADRVKVSIDGFKSDWLSSGQTYTSSAGFTIKVKDIYFQAYAGGSQYITYVLI